jgi:hypothetical protein
MNSRMFVAAALLLSACSSAPSIAPTPAVLTDVQYDAAMKAAQNPSDPFAEERNYTALLSRTDLSSEQLIRTQFMRAVIRGTTASDLAGSIADYEDLLARLPAEHGLFKRATDNLAYAKTQRGYIEGRIAKGPRAQPAREYLADLLSMGRFEDAKAFVKSGASSPSELQVEKFAKKGLMCEGSGYTGFRWGYSNTGYHTVGWCDAKAAN